MTQKLFFILLIVLSLNSCKNFTNPGSAGSAGNILLPGISGAAGEVLLVMDHSIWKDAPGQLIKEILEQEYPALPQPEPLFDLVQINPAAFDNLFQHHRTIIIASVGSEYSEAKIAFYENLWAKPQFVVKLNAPDNQSLIDLVKKESGRLVSNIQHYDRKRLIDVYKDSKDLEIKNLVSKFQIKLAVPRGYKIDLVKENFASLSIETPKTSQVIFIYEYPYLSDNQLETNSIIEKRNEFLQKYTKGSRTGSYMTTAPLFPPMSYDLVKNGKNYIEVRGLWDLVKGFMGGPFISHTTIDKARNRVVVVEGYVYNPNQKKRNLMRQMEAIVYSMEVI